MSELKAFDVGLGRYTEDGYPCVVAFNADGNQRLLGDEKVYLKSEVDKVIADKDKEIARLKAMAKEPSVPNRTCRKCGNVGTLMYMPIVKDGRIYWDLYNNKGIDYVFGIQCAHCGEVAFVTRQTHEYELRHNKYKRCLAMHDYCLCELEFSFRDPCIERSTEGCVRWRKWANLWLELAEKFKEAK